MGNGVIFVPPHNFEHSSRWLHQLSEIKKYEFGVVCPGMTSIPNFMKIRPAVLQLLNAYMRISVVKRHGWEGWILFGEESVACAGNGVIIASSHDFEHPSRRQYQL
jgi:hypothetical protein